MCDISQEAVNLLKPKDKALQNSIERGKRVQRLRKSLRLTRHEFSDRYNITASTLQNWEEGRYKSIDEEMLYEVLDGLARDGIQCPIEWIAYGIGTPPDLPERYPLANKKKPIIQPKITEEQRIQQELSYFHKLEPDAIDAIVIDNSMTPAFLKGDIVAGIRYLGADISKGIGEVCIVQTKAGKTLIRQLEKGTKPEHYNLIALNATSNHIRSNLSLFSCAPIIWMRRYKKET